MVFGSGFKLGTAPLSNSWIITIINMGIDSP